LQAPLAAEQSPAGNNVNVVLAKGTQSLTVAGTTSDVSSTTNCISTASSASRLNVTESDAVYVACPSMVIGSGPGDGAVVSTVMPSETVTSLPAASRNVAY